MYRKILVHTALLSFASTVNAAVPGLYMGVGAGPDITNFRVTSHTSQVQGGVTRFNVKNDDQVSGTGAFGTLFLGYGKKLSDFGWKTDNFYLAGELNANIDSLEHQNFNDEYVNQTFSTTKYTMPYNVGVSILPGYLYRDSSLFYGRLGYVNGNFKVSTSDISLTNLNRNLSGFRWGLGIQQAVTTQLSVRMEYSNISYSSTNISTFDPVGSVTKKTQFTPYTNEVEFGVVYRF